MSKIHDVLRLKFEAHLSNRHVAACLHPGSATLTDILSHFRAASCPGPTLLTSVSRCWKPDFSREDTPPSPGVPPIFPSYTRSSSARG